MKGNPLRYEHKRGFGRKPRECLPSADREDYIRQAAQSGCGTITLRSKNRYIDEFLRYCQEAIGSTEANEISSKQIGQFVKQLIVEGKTKESTLATKLNEIRLWFEWLYENERIAGNPFASSTPKELLRQARLEGK